MKKTILWDFDGTLGCRIDGLHGRAWSASMLEAIEELNLNQRRITADDILTNLTTGFPWHEPEKDHTHLNQPERWWVHMRNLFMRIYSKLGFTQEQAEDLARVAQRRFVDLSTWELYEDTIPVLRQLQVLGWHHIIVSNHVPELSMIVKHLGLHALIQHIVNSAEIGYEKPNPNIFKVALKLAGHSTKLWMIGDNVEADVLGAEAVGIQAILVRNKDVRAKYQFDDLQGVLSFLTQE